ncbi:FAD-dependent monooxygenase [Nocardioides panacis]|uniref:FAD-dependent monooxygenase n=1 Tax=Nocardioides panacis TaxID=2849501 RepID=A0A975T1N7_9ACTN|nr:FAD-dependent monooxygenase [Nocardioides panacis]
MTNRPDVLVVGAGPTGLTTALQAHDHGATVRVVERRPEAFRPSRAMIMHPRTLESLRPLGVTDRLLDRADRAPLAELHIGRRQVLAQLGEVGLHDTAFPHLTLLPQAYVEEVLADALAHRGVRIERGVEVVDASADDDAAHATLRSADRVEETACRFLAGCDGPASAVRTEAGIAWRGAGYTEEVVLADLELDGHLAPGVLHVGVGRAGLVFLFALGECATWRLLATRPAHDDGGAFGQPGAEVPVADVQDVLDATALDVTVGELRWSARVRLQHRLADTFRRGRLFLAGDAAHAHSPRRGAGHERRDPGRREPGVEAGLRRSERPVQRPAGLLRRGAPTGGAPGARPDSPGVLRRGVGEPAVGVPAGHAAAPGRSCPAGARAPTAADGPGGPAAVPGMGALPQQPAVGHRHPARRRATPG